jgi:hypothetical protein
MPMYEMMRDPCAQRKRPGQLTATPHSELCKGSYGVNLNGFIRGFQMSLRLHREKDDASCRNAPAELGRFAQPGVRV